MKSPEKGKCRNATIEIENIKIEENTEFKVRFLLLIYIIYIFIRITYVSMSVCVFVSMCLVVYGCMVV